MFGMLRPQASASSVHAANWQKYVHTFCSVISTCNRELKVCLLILCYQMAIAIQGYGITVYSNYMCSYGHMQGNSK